MSNAGATRKVLQTAVITGLCCAVLACPIAASAQDFGDPDNAAWLLSDDQAAVGLDATEERPGKQGPGFRWFVRVLGGGFSPSNGTASPTINVNSPNANSRSTSSSGASFTHAISEDITLNGTFFILDLNNDEPFTSGGGVFSADFGDAVVFNIPFNSQTVSRTQGTASLELMGQHLWTEKTGLINRQPAWRIGYQGPWVAAEFGQLPLAERNVSADDEQENRGWLGGFQWANHLSYGLRINAGRDRSELSGASDFLGQTSLRTDALHSSIGPQVAIGRVYSRGRWLFDLSSLAMVGYGHTRFEQRYSIDPTLLPSAAIVPTGENARSDDHVASHFELRLTTSYFIKPNWSLDATVRGFVTGPWYDSSELTVYTLPEFGLADADSDYLVSGNIYIGTTYYR